jgi:hypothetical protein
MLSTKGNGKKTNRSTTSIAYAGFLKDGTLFDTSLENVATIWKILINNERFKVDMSQFHFKQEKRWNDSRVY